MTSDILVRASKKEVSQAAFPPRIGNIGWTKISSDLREQLAIYLRRTITRSNSFFDMMLLVMVVKYRVES